MRTRDGLETDTRVVDAPDVPREAVVPPQRAVLDDPEKRRDASAESQQQVDGNGASRKFEVNRDELGRFDLKRAGLPDFSIEAAAKYVEEHRGARPWLAMTDGASPEARRIIVALDAAGGHAHIRHEGWVTEEANRRRVAYREDPAQLDSEKREMGIDGLRPDGPRHWCRATATRISDPDAFATAFARGVEHPKVREVLDRPIDPGKKPKEVTLSITELLGSDGNSRCTGWRLEPVNGSAKAALDNREKWITEGPRPDRPDPQAVPVSSFEGGSIVFAFMRNNEEQRHEVVTMYARPAQPKSADSHPGPDKGAA